jgi:hypothetical protein
MSDTKKDWHALLMQRLILMRRDLSVNGHSKDMLNSRVAMPIEALSEADLDRLEQSKIPDETKKLDRLVPEKW